MAKKNKPAIRFKEFTDAWEQRKVSEVAEICAGGTPSTGIEKYWHPKEIPWLSSGEVHKKYITYTDNKISVEGLNNSSARMIPANSVLIALAGQGKTRGTVAINRISLTTNQSIAAMIFSKEIVPEFVFCNLENRYEEIRRMSSGDGSRGGLNKQIVGEIEIPYTSKEEQAKIGAYFSKLDYLITLHQRKYDKLTNVKKSMLEKMFPQNGSNAPEIRFKGFTEAWEQRKLGKLGTITTGSTPSTSIPDYYSDDGIVWVTPTDICENITFESARKLSDLGQQVGRVVPKNTILVTCIASIGKNTMLGNTGSFNQQINGLTPNENECDPYFLLTESALWSAKMKSSAAAGTMQIVNRTEFSELKTWLPSLIEQQAISDFFRQLDHLITLHQRELEKLKNLKKACLEKMFV